MQPQCRQQAFAFQALGARSLIAKFDGGTITSDAGCKRSPDVRVEAHGKPPPGLPWQDRRIHLCNDHAARLAILASPSVLLTIREVPKY